MQKLTADFVVKALKDLELFQMNTFLDPDQSFIQAGLKQEYEVECLFEYPGDKQGNPDHEYRQP
jgi:hypothetical protein